MNPNLATFSTRLKVGLFALLGLLTIGVLTVAVNDKPYWWRPCKLVYVNVEDATGLKYKSPVRSLGLEIGYIYSVDLSETHVRLGICVTAPVEMLPETKAYMRGEGFLGDQFLELKPVRTPFDEKNPRPLASASPIPTPTPISTPEAQSRADFWEWLVPSAFAEDEAQKPIEDNSAQGQSPQDIPVGKDNQSIQKLVGKVNDLVGEMTQLTTNLKQGINPEELRRTMQQLNKTLENASRTLSPEGNLTTTARRALSKLEDSIEQLRQIMTRINEGKGSLGMLLNDPSYAEEIKEALKNLNHILNKVSNVRFVVDVGGEVIRAYDGSRGWFNLGIWPNASRYYLLGVTMDPRGNVSAVSTTTQSGAATTTVNTTQIEKGGFSFTAMLGKRFFQSRLDLSLGVKYGDAATSIGFQLGPSDQVDMIRIVEDVYGRSIAVNGNTQTQIDLRSNLIFFIGHNLYARGGLDSVRRTGNAMAYSFGGGISFDDEDIKVLFSLK